MPQLLVVLKALKKSSDTRVATLAASMLNSWCSIYLLY